MTKVEKLENTLLDQIQQLNDPALISDVEKARLMIERSKAISEVSNSFVAINRMKLDVVKELNKTDGQYDGYMGIEEK